MVPLLATFINDVGSKVVGIMIDYAFEVVGCCLGMSGSDYQRRV